MSLQYQQHIPSNFPDEAKTWIYQCNRLFAIQEAFAIEEKIKQFLSEWNTHGKPNKGWANLFFGQFIVIMADESSRKLTGCSMDSSIRFIKDLEQTFSVNLLDRQTLAFIIKDKIQLLPLSQLKYAAEHHFIDGDTLYFNNLAATKKELLENWIIPIKDSWLAKRLQPLLQG